jgi:hypothetical protein
VTVSVKVAVCVAAVPAPVTVSEYVPAATVDATLIDSVALDPDVTDEGDTEAVTPVGAPLTDRFTVCGLPEIVAVPTEAVVDAPAATVADEGESDTEKSSPPGVVVTVTV